MAWWHFWLKTGSSASKLWGNDVTVLKNGYVGTSQESVLTNQAEMKAARQHSLCQWKQRASALPASTRREPKTAKKNEARRRYATHMYTASLNRRARLAGMTVSTYCKQVRSHAERRASARLRTLKKRTMDSRDADGSAVATAQHASVRTSVRDCAGGAVSLGLDVYKAFVMVLGASRSSTRAAPKFLKLIWYKDVRIITQYQHALKAMQAAEFFGLIRLQTYIAENFEHADR